VGLQDCSNTCESKDCTGKLKLDPCCFIVFLFGSSPQVLRTMTKPSFTFSCLFVCFIFEDKRNKFEFRNRERGIL